MGKLDHDPVKDDARELNEASEGGSDSEVDESEDSGDELEAGDENARRTYEQLLLQERELDEEYQRIRSENERSRAQKVEEEEEDEKQEEALKDEQCSGCTGGGVVVGTMKIGVNDRLPTHHTPSQY